MLRRTKSTENVREESKDIKKYFDKHKHINYVEEYNNQVKQSTQTIIQGMYNYSDKANSNYFNICHENIIDYKSNYISLFKLNLNSKNSNNGLLIHLKKNYGLMFEEHKNYNELIRNDREDD